MPSNFDPRKHHRRSIRLPGYDYTQPGAYFITICTHQHRLLFGEIVAGEMRLNRLGQIAAQEWARLPGRFPFLEPGAFVVMPNHVHGILVITDRRGTANGRGTAGIEEDRVLDENRRAPTEPRFPSMVEQGTAGAEEDFDITDRRGTANGRGTAGIEEDRVLDENRRAPTEPHSPTTVERFGQPVSGSIPTIIRSYKSSVTLRINWLKERPNHPVWQRNYYEHVVRDGAEWERIQKYIVDNPRRWEEDRLNPNQAR